MIGLKKVVRYINTIRHLKLRQVLYQIFYRLKFFSNRPSLPNYERDFVKVEALKLIPSVPATQSYYSQRFVFLNKEKIFNEEIDWDYEAFGKLWAYNLNYFDFLHQIELSDEDAFNLIDSFCEHLSERRQGTEPYPISLRGINWIKFFSYRAVNISKYNTALFTHYRFLVSNPEYHLLGNHLLENGLSLLFGAYYFNNNQFYAKSCEILTGQLQEQVLKDGGHFELSPMYHQLILYRILDCINLVKNNSRKEDKLLSILTATAIRMVAWLKAVTFNNGDIPMVNDSAYNIAPTSESLFKYAGRLGIASGPARLADSGYRMIRLYGFELFVDIGNIGPDYIPGHAHSDTLNFILYINKKPIIVERGTSVYEASTTRCLERSTQSHNTVVVNGSDQSEMWASFRVGRRAKIIYCEETDRHISAAHNGYRTFGITHERVWQWNEGELVVTDHLIQSESRKLDQAFAMLHFHPEIMVEINDQTLKAGPLLINFEGHQNLVLQEYDFALGFNKTQKAIALRIEFLDVLKTTMTF